MSNWINITKEQFDTAYNQHSPSAWIKLAYRYFSNNTEMVDYTPRKIISGILLGLFGLGFLGTVIGLPHKVIGLFVIPYAILLSILVLYLFSAVFLNNCRIRKIRKILDITKEQYNSLVSNFYD